MLWRRLQPITNSVHIKKLIKVPCHHQRGHQVKLVETPNLQDTLFENPLMKNKHSGKVKDRKTNVPHLLIAKAIPGQLRILLRQP